MRTSSNNRTGNGQKPQQAPAGKAPSAPKRPGPSSPQELAAWLQGSAGNAAVVQMLRQAGHSWAQEEHRHNADCGHQPTEKPSQAVQRRSAVHDVLRTSGRPLDEATRADMEHRLGADFSDVRVHNDSAAKASAAEVGARAYTSGNHVVIGEGGSDRHTLAHELTHVIQQRRGPVAGTDHGNGLAVSDPSDRFEREAEANAQRTIAAAPQATPDMRRQALPSVQRAYDPAEPQNVMERDHWERQAGVTKPDGKPNSKAKGPILKAAKKNIKAGTSRTMDDIIKTVGPALLKELAAKPQTAGKLELFRSMSLEEAQGLVKYWGNPADRNALLEYVADGEGSAVDFHDKKIKAMTMGTHVGAQKQADTYHEMSGPSYPVQLKFTLKPGAHEILFDPQHMALGKGYDSELIRKSKGDSFQNASGNEGTLPGYIGVKSEKRDRFSLGIAQNKVNRDHSTASQMLFQLFVEKISVEKDKTKTFLPG